LLKHGRSMSDPVEKEGLPYQALARAALAAIDGKSIEEVARRGLEAAVDYIDLAAGALTLWDNKGDVVTRATASQSEEDSAILLDTEKTLLESLRRNFKLTSAYLELGGEVGRAVFSLPIEIGGRQMGALVGVKIGRARLHDYDEFLRSLAAVLALSSAPSRAIDDLAVGVNHEINNLLTPLLGNVDLLMASGDKLPEDVRRKLEIIRDSANQIKEVAARLKNASKLPRVPYVDGEWMVRLSAEDEREEGETETDKGETEREG
jgi:signal transduction histidine kinase